jgi:hypothetical protein
MYLFPQISFNVNWPELIRIAAFFTGLQQASTAPSTYAVPMPSPRFLHETRHVDLILLVFFVPSDRPTTDECFALFRWQLQRPLHTVTCVMQCVKNPESGSRRLSRARAIDGTKTEQHRIKSLFQFANRNAQGGTGAWHLLAMNTTTTTRLRSDPSQVLSVPVGFVSLFPTMNAVLCKTTTVRRSHNPSLRALASVGLEPCLGVARPRSS